jgi:NAD(P) transhydrogenase subunit alpha
MNPNQVTDQAAKVAEQAGDLAQQVQDLSAQVAQLAAHQGGGNEFWYLLTIFALAVFVGFYVVWSVTPALHSPLMAVTNAVSSVIIVGAILAAGPEEFGAAKFLGFLAVVLASVNIFGGFIVTQRMLAMFKKKGK